MYLLSFCRLKCWNRPLEGPASIYYTVEVFCREWRQRTYGIGIHITHKMGPFEELVGDLYSLVCFTIQSFQKHKESIETTEDLIF